MYQILPHELVVDNFAGGGGASEGIALGLGRHVDIAINHDPDAIEMHKVNHPETKHYCESVWDVDPVEACHGRPVGLAWFSPDCKHFSKAKGNRPVNKNIRGLAWVAVRWGLLAPPRVLMLENVEEFMTWGPVVEVEPGKFKPCPERKGETFEAFINALTMGLSPKHPAWLEACRALDIEFNIKLKLKLYKGLGYKVDHRVLKACDFGVPTIRKRFFLIARRDGGEIRWPTPTHGPKGSGLKPYRTAADIIDWSIPVKSIFGRKKPLVENTMKRVAKGLEKFVLSNDNPFIAPDECQVPFITEHANGSSQRNMPADEPLRTICAEVKGGHFALVTAFIARHFTDGPSACIERPLPTVTTVDHNALVTSHMVKLRGTNIGHGTDEPLHTVSAGGLHLGEVRAFLVKYYGSSFGESLDTPIGSVTTKDRFGLVMVQGMPIVNINGEEYVIVDIGMRMLEPHELFAAHNFRSDYVIAHDSSGRKVSKKNQVARCGNSVPPTMSEVLAAENLGSFTSEEKAA
ncbi:DNA cytosine methyltransferase [Vibrio europaeus]|uniref:DNA (cytosine-5-)-methyltransferase n=1 Tax=Vibrio europaeus TaxID=300876 RepID=A0ABT5GPH1_9VIBR|nr:DNA cytosine methyltransferase [Vibrio europaeus]MDC5723114.1 DNA cytosine methyltransferase [Vibrio europaeus]MDC5728071.1 DNA cytosine methyltransferase [Vibrio europaeus]MDC5733374.1 DNA cytosine methyltransferase [Vibrio europaeus]MDC5738587.1 DNA cytosine methyltransferase [Vibrio europaeus]MDC5743851.1 DNA cytosine methyltransferase [Vibrio europaeus]